MPRRKRAGVSQRTATAGESAAEARGILADLILLEGEVLLPEPDFLRWRDRLAQLQAAAREHIVKDLLALAVKLDREAGEAARTAVAQLCVLVSTLLVSSESARAMFKAAGLPEVSRAARVTGAEVPAKRPANTGGPAGSDSLFALRTGRKKP